MTVLDLPYGDTTLPLSLPDAWLGEVALPPPVAEASDPEALIRAALRNPIGSPPLSKIAAAGKKVAILVDDVTRKTPARRLLPLILEELASSGVPRDDISLVLALGTHRPMTGAELEEKLGKPVANSYRVVNIPSTDEGQMVYLGASSNGIPAWVNRFAAEADVRIGLGMITPHLDAGFSGGAKIVLPGVCSSRTVDAFHVASAYLPENQLGKVDCPLRLSLEQFVSERVPLHFIVNLVLTLDGEIYQCVAGDCIEAHRLGVLHARQVYGTPLSRRYPVVVTSCYPYDMDWWQSAKGVWGGDLMTADGGTLVVVTAAPEGSRQYPLLPRYIGRDRRELLAEIEAGEALDLKQASTGVMYGNLRRRIRLVLCSDGVSADEAEMMHMPYYTSPEQAVAEAVARLPEDERRGSVGVLTHGGIVLPQVG